MKGGGCPALPCLVFHFLSNYPLFSTCRFCLGVNMYNRSPVESCQESEEILSTSAALRFYSHALLDANQSDIIRSKEDPFSLVEDDISLISTELREQVAQVVKEVDPKLASAAKSYIDLRAQGKIFRPAVSLLMASALHVPISESLRTHQRCVIKSTEMIYVASLIHDKNKMRGIESFNFSTDIKHVVMASNSLLTEASVAVSQLDNSEVNYLFAKLIHDLGCKGAIQLGDTCNRSVESYLERMYYKSASFISTSCKAVAILAGQTAEVSKLAFEYGRNLGLVYQLIDDVINLSGNKDVLSNIKHGIVTAPILYAIEEFPQLGEVVDRGFHNPADVDLALEYLGKSRGRESTVQLAQELSNRAKEAIGALPDCDDAGVFIPRRALIDLPDRAIMRLK